MKPKNRRVKYFGTLFLFFLFINPIISISSLPNNDIWEIIDVPGNQYAGYYSGNGDILALKFNNKLFLNLSSNRNINLNIDFSPSLIDHALGFHIDSEFSQNTSIEIVSDFNAFNNMPTGLPINNPADYALSANPFNNKRNLIEDIYLNINFSHEINELVIFYDIKSLSTQSDSEYFWAYYNHQDETWVNLESYVEDDLLYTTIDSNESLYDSNQFTFSPVVLNPEEEGIWNNTITKIILIILMSFIGLIGLLMTSKEYREYLFNRIIHINRGVHTKLEMSDVLENEYRNQIIDYILENPGAHFNEIQKLIGLTGETTAWHLDVLETFKIIRKMRVGQYLMYFPYLENNPISKLNLKLSKSKTTLEILQLINDNPGMYQSKLAHRLDLNHKTVSYHLKKLMDADVIYSDNKKIKRGYYSKSIVEKDNLLNS